MAKACGVLSPLTVARAVAALHRLPCLASQRLIVAQTSVCASSSLVAQTSVCDSKSHHPSLLEKSQTEVCATRSMPENLPNLFAFVRPPKTRANLQAFLYRYRYIYLFESSRTGLHWAESRHRYSKVLADFSSEMVVDFAVPGNGTAPVLRGVMPPGVISAFPEQGAAMGSQMSQQIATLHTAILSSS